MTPRPFVHPRWGLLYPAAVLTLGASLIHFSVAPSHLQEYWPFGLFFLAIGAAQFVVALALASRPTRAAAAAGAIVAIGCLAVWAVSRTIGLPFGPSERIELRPNDPLSLFLQVVTADGQLAGVAGGLLELASLPFMALLLWIGPLRRSRNWWWVGSAVPATLIAIVLTIAGVVAGGPNDVPYALNMSAEVSGAASVPMDRLREQPGAQPVRSFTLTAEVATIEGRQHWTYNGTVPGPELRVTVGDRLRVTLRNQLPAATTIHWHGLRLPNAEDGVAGVTQDAVPPGGSYTYEFVVNDPGTYWYHSHEEPQRQVPLGLYGALVVEPKAKLAADVDDVLIVGDANDATPQHLAARPGDLVRLRVVSAFQEDVTGTPEMLVLAGAPYRVVALDGHDLNEPQAIGPMQLPAGSGQRYDLEFRMPPSGQVALFDERPQTGNRVISPEWATLGEGTPPELSPAVLPIFDLTRYGVATTDAISARTTFNVNADLHMTAAPGVRYGAFEFTQLFNGKTFPDTPTILVRQGEFVRIHLVNETAEYHPIHLHGHVLTVLAKGGLPSAGSPVHLDSILVGPNETWDVGFLADNPGLWMLHCHVLIHAAYGLSAMVSYEGVTTPYTIGTRSGNFPE
jgi:FtsP/CotA-like multicopper oxidase with cupredoxin domain